MLHSLLAFVVLASVAWGFKMDLVKPAIVTASVQEDTEMVTTFSIPLPAATSTLYSGESFFAQEAEAIPAEKPLEKRAESAMASAKPRQKPTVPVRIRIPSVGINSPVVKVGVNTKGEMDVPDGKTDNVGWYKSGTLPGNVGSAVLDAHVYAAFEDLRYLKAGQDIYIENEAGETLHFVVEDSRIYKLSELSPEHLFNRKDARRLNLITCAGKFVKSWNTYDRRLVVYATYAGTV